MVATTNAFSPSAPMITQQQQHVSGTKLFNIPPPSVDDKEAFKAYADKQNAPASFFELQSDCLRSTQLAIRDGFDLLEIEFPPLPANVLELDDFSAYDVAQANLKLALELARGFIKTSPDEEMNISVMFPDESEAKIAVESLTGQEDVGVLTEVEPGITISSLRRSEEGDDRILKVRGDKYNHQQCCFEAQCPIGIYPLLHSTWTF